MRQYGRERKIGGFVGKRDAHPKKGYMNWWEDMDTCLTRSRMRQIFKSQLANER